MLGYYKSGSQIDYANTGSAITAGDVVKAANFLGIAVNDIAATTGVGPVQVKGIVKVTKTGSQAWTLGQPIFYSGSNTFTSASSGNDFAGWAAAAVGSGSTETTGYIMLKGSLPGDALWIDGSDGTTDCAIISGNDLTLAPGDTAADSVKIQAYDIDATAYVSVITAASHATIPQLTIGNSAGGTAIGFHGKTPTTQQAHITDTTTDPTNITTAVNAILSRLETLGLIATS